MSQRTGRRSTTTRVVASLALALIVILGLPQLAPAAGPSPLDQYDFRYTITDSVSPDSIALTSDALYDGDWYTSSIWKFPLDSYPLPATATQQWGSDGSGTNPPQFSGPPTGLDIDSDGRIIATDEGNDRVMILNSDGSFATVIGAYGSGDQQFIDPMDVAIGSNDFIFVSDTGNSRIAKLYAAGGWAGSWTLPNPDPNPDPEQRTVPAPDGIAWDSITETLWVVDSGLYSRLYQYSATGALLKTIATFDGGHTFQNARGVAVGSDGTVYVADTGKNRVVVFRADGRYVQTIDSPSNEDESFGLPQDIECAADGTLYVSDYVNDRIQVFDYTRDTSDVVAPSTTSNIPTPWVKAPFEVILTATDAVMVDMTYYSLDESTPTLPYDTDDHFSVSTEGTTTVKYYSEDAAGNEETIRSNTLRVDGTPPETTDDHAPVYIASAAIRLDAVDSLSGVAYTRYSLDGGIWTTYNKDYPIAVSGNTTHTLNYYSTDVVGNAEPQLTEPIQFRIVPFDNDPPITVSNISSTAWRTSPIDVTLTATDFTTYVVATYYSLDGSYPTVPYTGSFPIDWEGTTPVKFYSVDSQNNTETVNTKTVNIDFTKPTTTADALPSYVSSATITLTATDTVSGVASTQYKIGTNDWATGTTITITEPGQWDLWYKSTDVAGNSETAHYTQILVLAPDNDPPSTTSNVPTGWTKGPFTVRLNTFDAVSGVAETFYSVNGTATTVTYSQEETQTSYVIEFILEDQGEYAIEYYSTDFRGNVSEPTTTTLRLDNAPPVTTDNHKPQYTETATIGFTATDNLSGVSSTTYRLDQNVNWYTAQSVTVNTYGDHTLYYRSTDSAGNVESTHEITFTVIPPDTEPPVTTSDIPDTWMKDPVTVTLTATDTVSDILNIWYSTDGGDPDTVYTVPFEISAEGTTTVKYYAKDTRDNLEDTNTEYVQIDETPPVTTTSNTDGDTYQGEAFIQLTPTDSFSGVADTYWRLNDGPWQTGTVAYAPWSWREYTLEYYSVDEVGNTEDHQIHDIPNQILVHQLPARSCQRGAQEWLDNGVRRKWKLLGLGRRGRSSGTRLLQRRAHSVVRRARARVRQGGCLP